jgi:hypothetical protein
MESNINKNSINRYQEIVYVNIKKSIENRLWGAGFLLIIHFEYQ